MIQRMIARRWCSQMKPKSSFFVSIWLAVFGGRGILTMTPRTLSPPSSMEVEALCFGNVSLLGGQVNFTASGERCMGPCTMKSWVTTSFSQPGQLNVLWLGLPAWQWPKTYSQSNKGLAQKEGHYGHWMAKPVSGPKSYRKCVEGAKASSCQVTAPEPYGFEGDLQRGVVQNSFWDVYKPGYQLIANKGFSSKY